MTLQIFFQLIGFIAFLIGGCVAMSQWSQNSSRERFVFGVLNLVGAGFALGLIVATLVK